MDATSADSLAHLSEDDVHGGGFSIDDVDLPVIPRWWDVQRAAAKIAMGKQLAEMTQLLADGQSQEEVAARLGISQPTASRRYRASMEELLEELGGSFVDAAVRNPVGTRKS